MNKAALVFGFVFTLGVSLTTSANELIDVGVGNVPDYDPLYWDPTSGDPAWTMSSTCVDINESGQAACRSVHERWPMGDGAGSGRAGDGPGTRSS